MRKEPIEKASKAGILYISELDPTKDVQIGTIVSRGTGIQLPSGRFKKMDPVLEVGKLVGFTNRSIVKETSTGRKKYNPNEFIEGEDTFVHVDAGDILFVMV